MTGTTQRRNGYVKRRIDTSPLAIPAGRTLVGGIIRDVVLDA